VEITKLGIKEISHLIRNKKVSTKEVVSSYLDEIHNKDSLIKAFLSVHEDEALRIAEQLDNENNKTGMLFGVPFAIKDNINVFGFETTAGSKILKGYIAPYNATVVKKIRNHGGIIIGKTNPDEFAMGSSTENSAFFPTKNPINTDYVPGGSSGGSAASVSGGFVPGSLGSDTGGSIRQPAAFCNVVGLKPTYGRVSRYGLIAFSSSLDCIGPITKNVEDAAIMLNVIAGFDENDETTAIIKIPDYTERLKDGVKNVKIGILKEIKDFDVESSVLNALNKAVSKLIDLGAEIVEVSIPHLKYALPAYYIIAPSEASANLSRFDGVRYGLEGEGFNLRDFYEDTRTKGFGREVKRRILIGTFALSEGYYDAYYMKASRVRRLIEQDFEKAFNGVDSILLPTTPTLPFKFGEKKSPLEMYMSDIFTIPVSLAGLPAISVPFGESHNGFRAGMQFIGKWFDEMRLFQYSNALFEEA